MVVPAVEPRAYMPATGAGGLQYRLLCFKVNSFLESSFLNKTSDCISKCACHFYESPLIMILGYYKIFNLPVFSLFLNFLYEFQSRNLPVLIS